MNKEGNLILQEANRMVSSESNVICFSGAEKFQATLGGDCTTVVSTGKFSCTSACGKDNKVVCLGDNSDVCVMGPKGVGISLGYKGTAKGALGAMLILGDYDKSGNLLNVVTGKVDNKTLFEGVSYCARNGTFKRVL